MDRSSTINSSATLDEVGVIIPASQHISDSQFAVSRNAKMLKVIEEIKILGNDQSVKVVFLRGEPGSGKEVCAKLFHSSGQRNSHPFIPINAAAIPESLFESALFGHEKGAFTGAFTKKRGFLKLAAEGTVFIDEIGKLAPQCQGKLLRMLEERKYWAVGADEPNNLEAAIVVAMSEDPAALILENKFLGELFSRIKTFTVLVPPLRERPEDIEPLSYFFLKKYADESGKTQLKSISPDVLNDLRHAAWEYNVRDLEGVIHKAVVFAPTNQEIIDKLPEGLLSPCAKVSKTLTQESDNLTVPIRLPDGNFSRYEEVKLKVDRRFLSAAMDEHHGNVSAAAKAIGMNPSTLRDKLKSVELDLADFREPTDRPRRKPAMMNISVPIH